MNSDVISSNELSGSHFFSHEFDSSIALENLSGSQTCWNGTAELVVPQAPVQVAEERLAYFNKMNINS